LVGHRKLTISLGQAQKESLQSVDEVHTESASEIESLRNQNAELPVLPATETRCQTNETPYPFDLPLSIGLGINTHCDQWPNTNVTFGSAPLLPFHAGDPLMRGGEVWNDVKHSAFDFSCKLPELSGPDPVGESVLEFTSLLTEGELEDWLRGFKCFGVYGLFYFGNAERVLPLLPPLLFMIISDYFQALIQTRMQSSRRTTHKTPRTKKCGKGKGG